MSVGEGYELCIRNVGLYICDIANFLSNRLRQRERQSIQIRNCGSVGMGNHGCYSMPSLLPDCLDSDIILGGEVC